MAETLPLVVNSYRCSGGPLDGCDIELSEHSRNSATITMDGKSGKYVLHGMTQKLVWKPIKGM